MVNVVMGSQYSNTKYISLVFYLQILREVFSFTNTSSLCNNVEIYIYTSKMLITFNVLAVRQRGEGGGGEGGNPYSAYTIHTYKHITCAMSCIRMK